MNIFKNNYKQLLIVFLFCSMFLFTGAVQLFQNTYVKGDGSGTIKITYSASESEVTSSKFQIGNFPFEESKMKDFFSSSSNTLKKSNIIKKDGKYIVNAEIDFKSVYKIKDMKGFNGTTSSFTKTDSGMVFYWNLKANQSNQSGSLEKVTYSFSFEGGIKSTTGKIKDKEILYYRDTKSGNFNFNTDMFCQATVDIVESKTPDNSKENSGENKSCGLFGIELPLILLAGLVGSKSLSNK